MLPYLVSTDLKMPKMTGIELIVLGSSESAIQSCAFRRIIDAEFETRQGGEQRRWRRNVSNQVSRA